MSPGEYPAQTMTARGATEQYGAAGNDRDSARPALITVGAVALLAFFLSQSGSETWSTAFHEWTTLAGWFVWILVIELFPVFVDDDDITWTLDVPLLLAVAVLYPPEVAAALAFIAALDARELRAPRTGVVRALFNRAQVGLSVYAAAVVFRAVGGDLTDLPRLVIGLLLGLATDYLVNFTLASLHLAARRRVPWTSVAGKFAIGSPYVFLGTFFGYGVLALVMAYMARGIGVWAVAIPLLPTLVARQALLREQRLHRAAKLAYRQERLLEKAIDRTIDERRDERKRISAELHDEVLQSLMHVTMLAGLIKRDERMKPETRRDVLSLIAVTSRAVESLQDLIRGLTTSPLGPGGLMPTLQGLVRDLRIDWQVNVRCDLSLDVELSPDAQVLIYQVAREALLNAAKHAQADEIAVRLRSSNGAIELLVEDTGIGFDPAAVDSARHFGLGLMEERVRKLEGDLKIRSRREGTRLSARFPLARVSAASLVP